MAVRVSGRGIAAASAAQCLTARAIPVAVDGHARREAPVVMLGEQAQGLLADVFGGTHLLAHRLAHAHAIVRRVVLWGDDVPQAFDHAARVIAGDALADALPTPEQPTPDGGPADAAPQLLLSTTAPPDARVLHFGAREARAVPVELSPSADRGAALVEALAAGWLFLIPTGGAAGWLLSVGTAPDQALYESRLVAAAVGALGAEAARFETAPRMLEQPCAPGRLTSCQLTPCRLTLGSAALALDPICGDGTATAVRGGILAAAVAAAIGGHDEWVPDTQALSAHYRMMLIAAMRRHLAVSWPFYARGGRGAWWQEEAAALADGHAWCTRQLAEAGEARFMLAGDRLIPRDNAA
jgi:hypothetical protein